MSPDELYTRIYAALCGTGTQLWPWHFQWHGTWLLRRVLAHILAPLGGRVLDLGCGSKPYQSLFGEGVSSYTGVDIAPGQAVDMVVAPGQALPFADASFDTVLCTQVLEHVSGLDAALAEIRRVMRPGGVLVASVPFLYHLHGEPHDYRRFTEFGLREALTEGYEVELIQNVGGIGGSTAISLLCWVHFQASRSRPGRYALATLLPLWLAASLCTNLAGAALDALDTTNRFPHALVAVARRS